MKILTITILMVSMFLLIGGASAAVPSVPTALVVTEAGHTVGFSWTVGATGNVTDGYNVTYQIGAETPVELFQTGTSLTVTSVPFTTEVTIEVYAWNTTNAEQSATALSGSGTTLTSMEDASASITDAVALIGTVGSTFIATMGVIFVGNLGVILTLVAVGVVIVIFSGLGKAIMDLINSVFGKLQPKK